MAAAKESQKETKRNVLDNLKKGWEGLTAQSRRILVIAGAAAVAFVVIGSILLGLSGSKTTENEVLFTGLSQDEAQQIVSYIGSQNVEYTYDATSGTINVPQSQADTLRAELLSQGYPKSGFTYDMYINNSGMMTTESDKKQYSIYDLQDRLGATIRQFDGVQDAKVTIAEGDTSTYALSDDSENVDSTASVVVTMQPNAELTEKNAQAIRNLIAHSVRGMNFTDVSVFDAATMTEVGSSSMEEDANAAIQDLTGQIEDSIASKVRNILGKIYGPDNVQVEVRGTLDPSSLVQESTEYSVPAQTDESNRTGLLESESTTSDYQGSSEQNAAGVAGADANADTPSYTTVDGTDTGTDASGSNTTERQYLYNILKKQQTTDPGTLSDLTVAVVINTTDQSVSDNDLLMLVADASGISRSRAQDKITVLRTGINSSNTANTPRVDNSSTNETPWYLNQQFLIAAAGALGVILLLILLLVLSAKRSKKMKKKAAEELEAQREAFAAQQQQQEETQDQEPVRAPSREEMQTDQQVARGNALRDDIGSFVDTNPQIAARLIENWLREGDGSGRSQRRTK
jgi:flagellar M-ring protein FliF